MQSNTMKIFKIFFLVGLLSIGGLSLAQVKNTPIRIQEIVLKDSFLVQQIEKLIHDEINNKVDSNRFFKKGLGYINLHLLNSTDRDVLRKYCISPGISGFRESNPDEIYPLFYSYVADRMVLIYSDEFRGIADLRITETSKRRFRRKLEPFLEKTQNITAYDSVRNVKIRDKHFRPDHLWMHSGKYIYIYRDKSAQVLNEREEELKNSQK